MHKHLQRLDRIRIECPIYFVTVCTFRRRPILARDAIAKVLVDELRHGRERHGWAIGSYVIMPDHVHFFWAPQRHAKTLSGFLREWKPWTSRRIICCAWPRRRDFLRRFLMPSRRELLLPIHLGESLTSMTPPASFSASMAKVRLANSSTNE